METRRFELVEGNSSKFWEVAIAGSELDIRWGRIGTQGQSQTKAYADDTKAASALGKLVNEKLTKGYSEVASAGSENAVSASAGTQSVAPPPPQKSKPEPQAVAAPHRVTPATGIEDRVLAFARTLTDRAQPQTESLDEQIARVFEILRGQIADGTLEAGEKRELATLQHEHAISEQAAELLKQRLENADLADCYTSYIRVSENARALGSTLRALASTRAGGQQRVQRPGTAPASAGLAPWLAQGEPLYLTVGDVRQAYASRRFPVPLPACDVAGTWQDICTRLRTGVLLETSDIGWHPALRRMLQRREQMHALPPADAAADTLLLALALHVTDTHELVGIAGTVFGYLVAQYGLVAAIDQLLEALRIEVLRESQPDMPGYGQVSFRQQVESELMMGWCAPLDNGIGVIRAHLAAADVATWDTCVAHMQASLPTLHPLRQPLLGLMLPDVPALSEQIVVTLAAAGEEMRNLHWLVLNGISPAAQVIALKNCNLEWSAIWREQRLVTTMLCEQGIAAVDVLQLRASARYSGVALAAIGVPRAIEALARVAGESEATLARLALALERWPLAALPALTRLLAGGGAVTHLLRPLLRNLLRTRPQTVAQLQGWLEPKMLAVLEHELEIVAGPEAVAAREELPTVLAAPPWMAKVKKKPRVPLVLEPLPLAAVEDWKPGAHAAAQVIPQGYYGKSLEECRNDLDQLMPCLGFYERRQEHAVLAKRAKAAIIAGDVDALILAEQQLGPLRATWNTIQPLFLLALPATMAVPFWNTFAAERGSMYGPLLATYGLALLPGLVRLANARPAEVLPLAQAFGAVELAAPVVRAFVKYKTAREAGREWLLKYPEHVACGLLPAALGAPGEACNHATTALRLLLDNGHHDLLQEVAARYGREEVDQALAAVLEEDPLDWFPARRGKLPAFWQPGEWWRPRLRNGKALDIAAIDAIGQMLMFPTHEGIYPGIRMVQDACTPASLAEFSWDLFGAWLNAGGSSKDGWALMALGRFGNDDIARRLTPYIRSWPGESAHARAINGLDVLASIGSDVALMLLNGIAQKVKFKGLQDKAREKIAAIAEARDFTTEELEDRLTPDLGLDENGSLRLDFGPRSFIVGFDEALKPYVRELLDGVPGVRLADLPKPRKSDDAVLAKQAVDSFKLLKKDVRTIAAQQVLRLEVAMCTRRRWEPEVFRRFLLEHPLLRHLVQRLVWGVYAVDAGGSHGGTLQACFRVAEDGSLADAEDALFEIPSAADIRIGLPHALELAAADAAAFGQLFADYELLQPFAQLGRDTYALTAAEKTARHLVRWEGTSVPTGRVLGLVNKGWRRGMAQDGGSIWYFSKALGAGQEVELRLDPGIIAGVVEHFPEQTLRELSASIDGPWGELDAIAASELIRDMEALSA